MIKNSTYIERRGEVPRLIPQVTIFTGFLCVLQKCPLHTHIISPPPPLFLHRGLFYLISCIAFSLNDISLKHVCASQTKIKNFPFHLSPPGHGQIPLQSQLSYCLHCSPTQSTKPLVAQKWYLARTRMASVLPNPLSSALS